MKVELPLGWKGLTLDRYDGSIDLDKHVDVFMTQVGLYISGTMLSFVVFIRLL